MAKIVDSSNGQFPTEYQGGDHTVIVIPENCVIPADSRQAFSIISNVSQVSIAGNYITRVSNPLEKGIVLGRIIEILPEATILSVHCESLLKMIPEPMLDERTAPDESNGSNELKEETGIMETEELKETVPIRSGIYKSIYQESLNKYIEKYVLLAGASLKIQSMKNQIKNFVSGTTASYMSNGIRDSSLDVDVIVNHIYSDLLKNNVFTEVFSKIEWNDEAINDLLITRTKRFKSFI